ncbi:A kinase (PRKA) anchor protein [Chamberlinius hualienensis]
MHMQGAMHACKDISEAVELYPSQGLYLKPVARLSITVNLPAMNVPGKAISNWEVMEKLKVFIKPEEFTVLKVTKSTLEYIRFEGETENRACLKGIASKLENRTIKLSGFAELLKVRAVEAKIDFPTRHDWDSYFRDAKNMNEMKSGERPDTIHFNNLPCRWFANKKDKDSNKLSEQIVRTVFETFGPINVVEIPMLDPYLTDVHKKNGTIQTFSFGQELTFETYVQYKEYTSFERAMTALRGMKLMYKGDDGKCAVADIKADFDRTKYLSEENIKKRVLERNKIIRLEKEREERVRRERELAEKRREEDRQRHEEEERERERKREEKLKKREERRKDREYKRRQKFLEKKLLRFEKETAKKEALNNREKLVEERQVEAARLLTILFERIKEDKCKEELQRQMNELEQERLRQLEKEEENRKSLEKTKMLKEKERVEKLAKEEKSLRDRIITNYLKKKQELEEQEREKRRKEIAGKTRLKSVLITKSVKDDPPKTSQPSIRSAIVR